MYMYIYMICVAPPQRVSYPCECGGPARKAAIGSRRRLPPRAIRCIQGSSLSAPNATLGSFPCACVFVSPLYIHRLWTQHPRFSRCATLSLCGVNCRACGWPWTTSTSLTHACVLVCSWYVKRLWQVYVLNTYSRIPVTQPHECE